MKLVRRTSGVESERIGCTSEWRTVGRNTAEGQKYDGKDRRLANVLRWPLDPGVTMSLRLLALHIEQLREQVSYLVRTMSSGARATPVATAAAPATKSETQGYGDAISISRSISSFTPRSGTLNIALRKLLPQFSSSD